MTGSLTINDNLTVTGNTNISGNTNIIGTISIGTVGVDTPSTILAVTTGGTVVDGSSLNTNFANTDLTFDNNRTHTLSGYSMTLSTTGDSNTFVVTPNGRVGVKTSATTSFDLEVNGTFGATSKSFVIPHPLKEGKKLVHGAIEGPEFGVYDRGRFFDGIIELPDYWVELVDESTITVQLTGEGYFMSPFVKEIKDNKVFVGNRFPFIKASGFYTVYGERKDINKIKLEIDA